MISHSKQSGYEPVGEDVVEQILANGSSVAATKGVTQEEIEAIYSISYNLYQQKKYEQAEKIFAFLCLYSHLDARFWIGLGASREALGQYRLAIDAYSYSALLEHDNPIPPLQAAKCYLALNERGSAEQGLTAAIHWSKGNSRHQSVLLSAQELLKKISNKSKGAVS